MEKYYAKKITPGYVFLPDHGTIVGKFADTDIDLMFYVGDEPTDQSLYALNGWDGEKWAHCWKCTDRFTADPDGKQYEIAPIYDMEAWNDDAGEFQDSEGNAISGIIGYEVL